MFISIKVELELDDFMTEKGTLFNPYKTVYAALALWTGPLPTEGVSGYFFYYYHV